MEVGFKKILVNELTQGLDQAKQLRFHLCSTAPFETRDLLLQRIINSYEKSLSILNSGGQLGHIEMSAPNSGGQESPVSVDGSPRSEDLNKNFKDHCAHGDTSKKRKLMPTWSEQVRVNSENGLEGPTDDGYSWRKYGQKDILGAKYPRSYYRCTYRLIQNCLATKQVQRSDGDPTIFEVTYKGTHMCNQCTYGVPKPEEPEKQEPENWKPQKNHTILDLQTNLRVNTYDSDNKKMPSHYSFPLENSYFPSSTLVDDSHLNLYSPLFLSPALSESNYFSPETYQMKSFGRCSNLRNSECDSSEIISAQALTTNSPIGSVEFPIDQLDLDPNMIFDTLGFFT